MQLAPGDKLDHFEVLSNIGAGGMGEVYKARDTRLNRIVAIKVSRAEFSQRFEREAKAVATLNHPHIAQLYDVGKNYIVMEYVEGAPLKGPLPLDKTLEYAAQIADALDHAHTRGITHRDLKPANILLAKTGVKILDFGLAKISHVSTDAEETQTMELTRVGAVMGTPAYMAPEQLEGKPADARADLYAFGLVLYEIATGKRSHPHKDRETLEPAGLQKVFLRAAAPDPEERWQSARDLRQALDLVTASGPAIQAASRPLGWIAAAAFAALAAAVLTTLYHRGVAPAPQPIAKLSVLPPPNEQLYSESAPLISPDGTKLAFLAGDATGTNRVWVRSIDSLNSQPVAGTESARTIFWSADSRAIGFQTVQYEMRRVDLSGGGTARMCDVVISSSGGTWNATGQILVGSNLNTPLYAMSTGAGRCQTATVLDQSRAERGHAFPQFLPDGRHFLFFAASARPETTGIVVGSLDSKESKFLLATPSPAVYASGYLLSLREQTLVAQRFDPDKFELSGDLIPIAENVATNPYGDAMFSVSNNGVLVYRAGTAGSTQLTWVNRDGKTLGVAGPPGEYVNVELSHDGKQVAFQRRNSQGDRDIWQMSLERGTPQRFTFGSADETSALWSPDGSKIAFASNQDGASGIFQKSANGGGNDQLLFQSDVAAPQNWSPDGTLFFRVANAQGFNEVWYLPASGDGKAVAYIQSKQFNRNQPRKSPKGPWVAYYSPESGQSELYLEPFPKLGGKWQVSTTGGVSHRWSRDGKELFYIAPNGDLMSATVSGTAAPELGMPKVLFRMRVLGGPRTLQGYRSQYDVAPDGRFLVNVPVDEAAGASMTVVLNWTAGLK